MQERSTTAVTARATVIVPTYNESDNLPVLVKRIRDAMPDAEILVVDDHSPDGTAAKARELGVRVVERTTERGLSTAVLKGLAESATDICVVIDADLSHPPEKIPDLVAAVEQGADIAVGSRYCAGGEIDRWPFLRRMTSKTGTMLARPLTSCSDPLAGYFCLRRSLLKGVELKPRGFKILLEILARAKPAKIAEVPIHFEDRGAGASKFSKKERREYVAQLGSLYVDLNAWPLRLAKFLVTGATGVGVNAAVYTLLSRLMAAPVAWGMTGAFAVAMTSNYALNRVWTFRARKAPLAASYLLYAMGTLGGLAVQLAVSYAVLGGELWSPPPAKGWKDFLALGLGIAAGTVVNYLASEFIAFGRRRRE